MFHWSDQLLHKHWLATEGIENEDLGRNVKYMFQRDPDNIKYLDRWEKKFGFEGNLSVEECKKIVKAIEERLSEGLFAIDKQLCDQAHGRSP